jgi:hypothetical protein
VFGATDKYCADLFVCEEFDSCVGKDSENSSRVPAEETPRAVLVVYEFHGGDDAGPGPGVFGELGVAGLEEDLDAVERGDDGFGLRGEGLVC